MCGRWIQLAHDCCDHSYERLGSINCGKYFGYCQVLKNHFAVVNSGVKGFWLRGLSGVNSPDNLGKISWTDSALFVEIYVEFGDSPRS